MNFPPSSADSLSVQLKALQKKSESRREQRQVAVMRGATSDLIKKGIEKTALQTGDIIPPFELPNAHNESVSIFDALKSSPVVLVFYRGSWCPYCNLALRAYQERLADIQNCGAQLIAVSPELPASSSANAKTFGLAFEILSDAGNVVAKQFGLAYKMPADLIAVYLELGTDIPHFNGDDTWELPVPATYIIGARGEIMHSSINAEYLERIDPQQIIGTLRNKKKI